MKYLQLFSLAGKKAIVTGGARGLGLEMSKALAGAGADVALMYVSSEKTHDTAADIAKEFNVKCKAYKADMGNAAHVQEAIENIYKDFGEIDIFVANAGIAIEGPSETFDLDDWRRIFDVNVHGVFYGIQAAGQRMLKAGTKGSIILISSMSGLIANRPQPHCGYNASKGAVNMMTQCLAQEWAQRGIRVNSINPGYMETEMLKDIFKNNPQLKTTWESLTPMGRVGRPDELNGAIVFLASDSSSYVTGAHLYIDGGYTCV
ncbi:NAD(P)-binding protein [Hesseltinella vesiculosa]|uniref:NAD(P)-binding protein n=1 Tax=Hesseltinella vesiculosa TaxID=101127 RepID=A0A1X2GV25_9FUNG|nr:NAD(P)-binding protein [Hesseltinella vesiculosa]